MLEFTDFQQKALLAIADSRLQQQLAEQAQHAGKLPRSYEVPEASRQNLPQHLAAALAPFQKSGLLPKLPFGNDLTDAELALAARLGKLKTASSTWKGRLQLLGAFLAPADAGQVEVAAALKHLQLGAPASGKERRLARLVRAAWRL